MMNLSIITATIPSLKRFLDELQPNKIGLQIPESVENGSYGIYMGSDGSHGSGGQNTNGSRNYGRKVGFVGSRVSAGNTNIGSVISNRGNDGMHGRNKSEDDSMKGLRGRDHADAGFHSDY